MGVCDCVYVCWFFMRVCMFLPLRLPFYRNSATEMEIMYGKKKNLVHGHASPISNSVILLLGDVMLGTCAPTPDFHLENVIMFHSNVYHNFFDYVRIPI